MKNVQTMSPAERTRYAVVLVLTRKHGIPEERAEQMVNDSSFSRLLVEDPVFVGHRSADYWADDILDEYSLVH
jgi:hypothetical protein